MNSIISSIIGATAGSITAFILTNFKNITLIRNNDIFYKGDKYHGVWELDGNKEVFEDELLIESILFGKIKCIGTINYEGKEKKYKLSGKVGRYCITFTFFGLFKKRYDNTAGVILFEKRRPDTTELSGKWVQLRKDGTIINGIVTLKKI